MLSPRTIFIFPAKSGISQAQLALLEAMNATLFQIRLNSSPEGQAKNNNQREKRKGAFWEDRYHATAVESGEHLFQCLVYIDLNMVCAGVVAHPSEWPFCGYNEIQKPRSKKHSYRL